MCLKIGGKVGSKGNENMNTTCLFFFLKLFTVVPSFSFINSCHKSHTCLTSHSTSDCSSSACTKKAFDFTDFKLIWDSVLEYVVHAESLKKKSDQTWTGLVLSHITISIFSEVARPCTLLGLYISIIYVFMYNSFKLSNKNKKKGGNFCPKNGLLSHITPTMRITPAEHRTIAAECGKGFRSTEDSDYLPLLHCWMVVIFYRRARFDTWVV